MSNLGSINPAEIDTSRAGDMGYSLMEDGPTAMKVTKFQIVPNKSDSNYENIEVEYTSVDETNPGKIYEWIVLSNSNEKAVEIGTARIAAIAKSIGINEVVTNTSQIENKICAIDVGKKVRDNDATKVNNVVKRYLERAEWEAGMPKRPVNSPMPETKPAPNMNAPVSDEKGSEAYDWQNA